MQQDHEEARIPLVHKEDMTVKNTVPPTCRCEHESLSKPESNGAWVMRRIRSMIQNNYTPVMYASLLLFPEAFVWTIIFSIKTQLGINFLMLFLFTCVMAIIVIGFAMAKVPTLSSGIL